MKYLIVRTFTFLGIAVGSLVAMAGAQSSQIAKFKIPFAFVAGKKAFPAGEYSVVLTDTYVLVLRDAQGRSALAPTTRFDLPAPTGKTSVQFAIVDGQHILTKVKNGNDSGGRALLWTPSLKGHSSLR